jgi:hypothetical protein
MLTARPILEASGLPLRRFREAVGTNTRTLRRCLDEEITIAVADRWCVRLGLHPAEVYGLGTWLEEIGFERA